MQLNFCSAPTLLLVSDERVQQDILDHFRVFHKLKTVHSEGKFSTNTAGSLQGTAFISFIDNPKKIPA